MKIRSALLASAILTAPVILTTSGMAQSMTGTSGTLTTGAYVPDCPPDKIARQVTGVHPADSMMPNSAVGEASVWHLACPPRPGACMFTAESVKASDPPVVCLTPQANAEAEAAWTPTSELKGLHQ